MISVCIIAKNEEDVIGKALRSVAPLSSDLIVLDTGSSDRTCDVARSEGARVESFKWCDDFAAAKNAALALAKNPWILSLDADEIISESDHKAIQELVLGDRQLVSFIQTTYSFQNNGLMWQKNILSAPEAKGFPGYIESRLVRLFPNQPELKFVGRIHENVEPRGILIPELASDIRIHHYGMVRDYQRLEEKKKMYARIADKKMRENPNDSKAAYEAGIQWMEIGCIAEAVNALERSHELFPTHKPTLVALGILANVRNDNEAAIVKFKRVIELQPDHVFANLGAGMAFFKKGSFSEAENYYLTALMADEHHPITNEYLGALYLKTGQFSHAAKYMNKAASLNPANARLWFQLGWAYLGNSNTSDALESFKTALLRTDVPRDCYEQTKKMYEITGHVSDWERSKSEYDEILANRNV